MRDWEGHIDELAVAAEVANRRRNEAISYFDFAGFKGEGDDDGGCGQNAGHVPELREIGRT